MLNDEQYIQMQSMVVGLKSMANQVNVEGMREYMKQEKSIALMEYLDSAGLVQNMEDLLCIIESLKNTGVQELIDDSEIANP